jgi:hypothetical protein
LDCRDKKEEERVSREGLIWGKHRGKRRKKQEKGRKEERKRAKWTKINKVIVTVEW